MDRALVGFSNDAYVTIEWEELRIRAGINSSNA